MAGEKGWVNIEVKSKRQSLAAGPSSSYPMNLSSLVRGSVVLCLIAALTISQRALPNAGLSTYGAPPSQPEPAGPILKDITIQINVIFSGFPENYVDVEGITRDLPMDYSQINRQVYIKTGRLVKYSHFILDYNISLAPHYFADAYSEFILQRRTANIAPLWLQEQGVRNAWYVPVRDAEDWIRRNAPTDLRNGYTIFIIETLHSTPSVKEFYFYNASFPAPDTGIDPNSSVSTFTMAFGGNHRFLVVDLNAGPASYKTPGMPRPIFLYEKKDRALLSRHIAEYIRTAIETRFIPSFLYEPKYRPQYYLNVTVFSKDPQVSYVCTLSIILEEYRKLLPTSQFKVSISELLIDTDPELFDAVNRATINDETDPDAVANYFLSRLDRYGNKGRASVIPTIIFAGYNFGRTIGRAQSDPSGNPAIIFAMSNRVTLGVAPVIRDFRSAGGGLRTGEVWYEGARMNRYTRMELSVTLRSGQLTVYVLDAYDFFGFTRGTLDLDATNYYLKEIWGPGNHTLSFSPPGPGGKFYAVALSSGSEVASYSGHFKTVWRLPLSLTQLAIHETAHFMGLPHPHDGFSWTLYDRGLPLKRPGEYVHWLWDFSATPLTYAIENLSFDKLDRDNVHRGMTLNVLNATFVQLEAVKSESRRRGFQDLPERVSAEATASVKAIEQSIDLFSSRSPDYEASLGQALIALEKARTALDQIDIAQKEWQLRIGLIIGTILVAVTIVFTYARTIRSRLDRTHISITR